MKQDRYLMNKLLKIIRNPFPFLITVIIITMLIFAYSTQKQSPEELQFINAINEKVKESGGWKFINTDGWKIGRDEKDNLIIARESFGSPQATTLLSLGAINNWPDAVSFILENGGDVNAADSEGETALHKAAYTGADDMVNILLKKGANIKAVNRDGMTPLHLTVFFKRYEAAKILLKNGADINAVNKNGETPLYILKNYIKSSGGSAEKMEKLFLKHGGILNKERYCAWFTEIAVFVLNTTML